MSYSEELKTAIDAAHQASDLIRSFKKSNYDLDVTYKGRHDLVTKADVASEESILSFIKNRFPEDHFMAEESAAGAGVNGRTWIIDPIDGTTNFAHDFPAYCVSIAFYDGKTPKVGVVLEITSGELFHAVEGEGAYLNGNRISVSKLTKPDEALLGTGFPYRDLDLVDQYLALFKTFMYETQGVRRPGSAAYDLCCVAAGRFEGFYEYALAPWDVAAGVLIILEAGGIVTDWKGGEDWITGRRIIAANPEIHAYLLKSIQAHIEKELL